MVDWISAHAMSTWELKSRNISNLSTIFYHTEDMLFYIQHDVIQHDVPSYNKTPMSSNRCRNAQHLQRSLREGNMGANMTGAVTKNLEKVVPE